MRGNYNALVFLLLFVCCTGSALAQQSFTYQGMLKISGIPAKGKYDFRFRLYSDPDGSNQVGSAVFRANVPVQNGLFTVQLDFGDVWTGEARYMEISVRRAGVGSYTVLSPMVAINSTPYSIFARRAQDAQHVPWAGITGMPAGFADGVDNDTIYTAGAGLQLSGNAFSITSGGVVSAMLADGAVVTGKIADGSVTTAKIGDAQVTDEAPAEPCLCHCEARSAEATLLAYG